MKPIRGVSLGSLPITGLSRVRDLIHFDGPLLTEFAHPRGDRYLFYWCDCDEVANRWMVMRVSETSILRLTSKYIPLDRVIPAGCRDDYVYFVDIASNGAYQQVALCPLDNIPDDYKPEKGVYLSEADLDSESYAILIEGELSVSELGDLPKKFSEIYAVLYLMNVLHISYFQRLPWRGGFSAMHFFRDSIERVPSEHRPHVSRIQYASPGFMRFDVHVETAQQAVQCVKTLEQDHSSLRSAYADLNAYIREHKLNDITSPDDSQWKSHDAALLERASALLSGFSSLNYQEFIKTATRPFEAAKIAMAFYRRVGDLARLEREGLVRFPEGNPD